MEYAARLPKVSSRRTIVAPIVALLVGAGAATGAYALIDNGGSITQPAKVIVVEKPGPNAAVIPGKNEAGTAAAISHAPNAAVIPGKNEAGTAAAISHAPNAAVIPGKNEAGTAAAISQSSGIEPRGSKASATNEQSDAQSAAEAVRTDPHGPANFLH